MPQNESRIVAVGVRARVCGAASVWLAVGGASLALGCGTPAPAATADSPSVAGPTAAGTTSAAQDDRLGERLSEASSRAAAVDELVRRYAAAARNGTQTEPARQFANQYAKSASQAYVDAGDELSDKQRLELIKTLVASNHDETAPALAHAITRYTTTGVGVEEAIYACQGAQRIHSPEIQSSLLASYAALDTSNADGLRYSRHLATAMSAQRHAEWMPTFVEELQKPLLRPARFDDKPAVKAFQSGLFRQTIATRLLGESGSQEAVTPILQVLLDAEKAEVHPAAELAIVKLQTVAVPRLLELLRGEGELVNLAQSARKDERQAHIYFATKFLDLLRLPSTEGELLEAWSRTKDPVARTLLVRSLSRLPGTKAGIEELKTTYTQTDIKVTLPEGESALETLSDAAVQFYEPNIALWLEERVGRVPTVWTRRGDVQVALVLAMSRLLTAEQIKATSATAQRFGGKPGTPAYETAKRMATECQSDAKCYVKAITAADTPFAALKATTMAGCFGDATTRDALLEIALTTDDQELLNQLLAVIEHLTRGDAATTAATFAARAKPELESVSPKWPRGKRAAIASTIGRLQARP